MKTLTRFCVICDGMYASGTYSEHRATHPPAVYGFAGRLERRGRRTDEHSLAVTVAIKTGASGAAVARVLGISRERVRQIWVRQTGTPLPHGGRRIRGQAA